MQNDIKRISSAINSKEIEDLKNYVDNGNIEYSPKKHNNFFKNAHGERSRAAATLKSITEGMVEGSIIEVLRGHYNSIHPTQKPVRLLERLLALVLPKDVEVPVILDPFAGSFSTGETAINMGCFPILIEMDREYYLSGKERIDAHILKLEKENKQLKLFH